VVSGGGYPELSVPASDEGWGCGVVAIAQVYLPLPRATPDLKSGNGFDRAQRRVSLFNLVAGGGGGGVGASCGHAQPPVCARKCSRLETKTPTTAMPSTIAKQKAQAFTIFEAIQNNSYLQDILVITTSDSQKNFFINQLLIVVPDAFTGHSASPPDLFNLMATWFGRFNGSSRSSAMDTALKQRRDYFITHRHKKVDFINRIGLNWSPIKRDMFFTTIKSFFLPKLETPYPVVKHWICESDAIDSKWRDYLQNDLRAQPDRRRPRLPIFRMDPTKLQLDIKSDESALVYDHSTGNLILLVLRQFGNDPNLLSHIDGVIKQSVDYRRSIRV
jgi:hypothetical protein